VPDREDVSTCANANCVVTVANSAELATPISDGLGARGTTGGEDRPGPVDPAPGQRIGGGDMRIAVVGCGYWGSKHVRVLQALAEVDRVVAVDSRPDRLVALKRKFDPDNFFHLNQNIRPIV